MNCKHVQELLPLYVSRDLEEKSAQLIQAHLQTCAACAASGDQYRETRRLLEEFATPMFSEAVYNGIRQNVLREIRQESLDSSNLPQFVASLFPRRLTWALAAALLVAVAFSAVYFIANRKGTQTNDQPPLAGGRNVVDRPESTPTKEQEEHQATNPRQQRAPAPGLAGGTHRFERRKNDATIKRAPSVAVKAPENTQLIAEAARNGNNPTNREIQPVRDSTETKKALRLEIQTKDPNIRIIWFSAQPTKQDSPNKFSKGI